MFAGLMLLASLFDDGKCYTFMCKFTIEPQADIQKSHDRIACIAEIESYDGDHPKMASFDAAAVDKYNALTFSSKKPFSEITEVVKITGHRFETHPLGIGSQFPSITNFMLSVGKLWRLTKNDLKQFPNIDRLDYSNNEIQYLETDLFLFNSKVRLVFLQKNHITQVSHRIGLDAISKLEQFFLDANKCTQADYKCGCTDCVQCRMEISKYNQQLIKDCPELEIQLLTDVKTEIADVKTKIAEVKEGIAIDQSFIQAQAEKTASIEAQIIKINQNFENHNEILERVYKLLMVAQDEMRR